MTEISTNKYRCPACGFQVFNRRFAKCESCGAALPGEMLFTAAERAALDTEHERRRKEIESAKKKKHQRVASEGVYVGDVGVSGGEFGGSADGGCSGGEG